MIRELFARLSSPLPRWEGVGVSLLLLLWSASLTAQTTNQVTDPFPDVPYRQYYGNMLLTAKAVMNGEVLTGDVVIAVYYGDEIRGKDSPTDADHPGVTYLTVYGNYEPDHFHCKVAVGGTIIEVDPGDLAYKYNGVVGTFSDPYIIDVPAPVTTTPSADGWATTCLPFNAEVPAGVTVWYGTGIADSELLMTKAAVGGDSESPAILPAHTPVLLQSEGKSSYEWLSRVADGNITTTGSIFVGTTEPTVVAASSVLTLGHSNETGEIGFWRFTGTTIPANRAYIADFPTGVRGVKIGNDDDTVTGISIAGGSQTPVWQGASVYSLDGRRLSGKPATPGIYVTDGKKIIIR